MFMYSTNDTGPQGCRLVVCWLRIVGLLLLWLGACVLVASPPAGDEEARQQELFARYQDFQRYLQGKDVPPDPRRAFRIIRQLADEGWHEAMNVTGLLLWHGIGTPRNRGSALSWWRRAAAANHLKACFNLAEVLLENRTRAAMNEAKFYLEKIVTTDIGTAGFAGQTENLLQLYPEALFRLWTLHREGRFKNGELAHDYLRRAALYGHPIAQLSLACLHAKGEDLPLDFAEAEWQLRQFMEQVSARRSFFTSKTMSSLLHQDNTERIAQGMISISQYDLNVIRVQVEEQLADKSGQSSAYEVFWQLAGACFNQVNAQFQTGLNHYRGHYLEASEEMALEWWEQAARRGHRMAEFNRILVLLKRELPPELLAECHHVLHNLREDGFYPAWLLHRGVEIEPLDQKEAWQLTQSARNNSDPYALLGLAFHHLEGMGVPTDIPQAVTYLAQAYELEKLPQVAGLLAQYYMQDMGRYRYLPVYKQYTGRELAQRAVEGGSWRGQHYLALMYYYGTDKVFDFAKAAGLWQEIISPRHGHPELWLYKLYSYKENNPIHDQDTALGYLRASADKNCIEACYLMGRQLLDKGLPNEQLEAEAYLQKASDSGHHGARRLLAEHYQTQNRNPGDEERFLKLWEIMALEKGPYQSWASYKLAHWYAPPGSIIPHPEKARFWIHVDLWGNFLFNGILKGIGSADELRAHSAEPYINNILHLAEIEHLLGNYELVHRIGRSLQSLDGDNGARASILLARLEEAGLLGSKSPRKALRLVKKAYRQSNAVGGFHYGRYLLEGIGTKPKPEDGLKLIHAAAMIEDPNAYAYLGKLYLEGKILAKDKTKAIECLVKGAKGGNADAVREMGRAVVEGELRIFGESREILRGWLTLLAQQQDPAAEQILERFPPPDPPVETPPN